VTLDYDLVYGVSIDASDKSVLHPDNRLHVFKKTIRNLPLVTDLPKPKQK
jgi:hypothetical protein